jgi:hypothetical protein
MVMVGNLELYQTLFRIPALLKLRRFAALELFFRAEALLNTR